MLLRMTQYGGSANRSKTLKLLYDKTNFVYAVSGTYSERRNGVTLPDSAIATLSTPPRGLRASLALLPKSFSK